MNQNILLLGVAGAAALYFMSQKKQEEEDADEEAAVHAEKAAVAIQEAAEQAAEQIQEDLPAVQDQVLKALEGMEEAIDLQLTEAPLGAFWNPAPLVVGGMTQPRQTVLQEIQSGAAKMTTNRIGKRLYEVTITRPTGAVLTVRAKVIPTPHGPKVVLFKPGEGFKAAVKVRRERRKAIKKRAMMKRRRRGRKGRKASGHPAPPSIGSAPPAPLRVGIIGAIRKYAKWATKESTRGQDVEGQVPLAVLRDPALTTMSLKSVKLGDSSRPEAGRVVKLVYSFHVEPHGGKGESNGEVEVVYSHGYGECRWPSCVPPLGKYSGFGSHGTRIKVSSMGYSSTAPGAVSADPVETPGSELREADNLISGLIGVSPVGLNLMVKMYKADAAQEETMRAEAAKQRPQMLAALKAIRDKVKKGHYKKFLRGLSFRRWVILRMRLNNKTAMAMVASGHPGARAWSAADAAAIEAELNALLDAEGFPAASGEDLSGLHSSLPNFGYLGWS